VEAHWAIVRDQFAKWKPTPEPTPEFVRDASQCEYGRMYRAVQNGEVVVSLLAFAYAGELFFWQGARSTNCPKGANNLLFSEVIRSARVDGIRTVNFGGSLGDSGIERFKEDFGAVKTLYAILKRTHPLVNLVRRGRLRDRKEESTAP
jgi:lipid II:glycine glycyltransferase (peptidoglycan interpeptide bridge formation enzyme)